MIDFELTAADQEILKLAHQQAEIGRRYASYYDKHEDELPPAEFPEAAKFANPVTLAEEGVSESSGPRILHSLVMLETTWGGMALHRSKWDSATPYSERSQLPSKWRSGRATPSPSR